MLYIEKKAPPQSFQKAVAEIKSTPAWRSVQDGDTAAIRSQFDLLPKSEIRDALLAEQHYLCAYCMKRIRNNTDGKAGRNGTGMDTATGLVKGRRDAYKKAKSLYVALSNRRQLTSAQIRKLIQQIKQQAVYPEFAGTVLFVLERKRKQLESQGK